MAVSYQSWIQTAFYRILVFNASICWLFDSRYLSFTHQLWQHRLYWKRSRTVNHCWNESHFQHSGEWRKPPGSLASLPQWPGLDSCGGYILFHCSARFLPAGLSSWRAGWSRTGVAGTKHRLNRGSAERCSVKWGLTRPTTQVFSQFSDDRITLVTSWSGSYTGFAAAAVKHPLLLGMKESALVGNLAFT